MPNDRHVMHRRALYVNQAQKPPLNQVDANYSSNF
jgi:hypothetical protein